MEHSGLVPSLVGTPVLDAGGELVGRVDDVLFDVHTHQLAWFVIGRWTLPATLVAPSATGYRLRCHVEVLGASAPLADRDAAVALCRRFGVLLPSPGPWAGARPAAPSHAVAA